MGTFKTVDKVYISESFKNFNVLFIIKQSNFAIARPDLGLSGVYGN
jgi:hypothetical protein